jgi:pimeloyl-ACP methyl ester carboxylesterase
MAVDRRTILQLATSLLAASRSRVTAQPMADIDRAIIRLSLVNDDIIATTRHGNVVSSAYDAATGQGLLGKLAAGTLAGDDDTFTRHMTATIKAKTTALGKQPVVVMVHGFMADPREDLLADNPQGTNNPHDFSFHYGATHDQLRHTSSWPLGLGFKDAADAGASGLAVAFGWLSTPALLSESLSVSLPRAARNVRFADMLDFTKEAPKAIECAIDVQAAVMEFNRTRTTAGYQAMIAKVEAALEKSRGTQQALVKMLPEIYREPYRNAAAAGWVLANVIRTISRALPQRPVDLFCHSLGSRTVLQALLQLAKAERNDVLERVDRVVIIGGAEYSEAARATLDALTSRGLANVPQFYNFTAQRDRVLQYLAEEFRPVADIGTYHTVGRFGLDEMQKRSNWISLEVDPEANSSSPLNRWLAAKRASLRVEGSPTPGWLNHWHYFTDAANMAIYKAIFRQRDEWTIARLRADGVPE